MFTSAGDDQTVRPRFAAPEVDAPPSQPEEEQLRPERVLNQTLQVRPLPRRGRGRQRERINRISMRL